MFTRSVGWTPPSDQMIIQQCPNPHSKYWDNECMSVRNSPTHLVTGTYTWKPNPSQRVRKVKAEHMSCITAATNNKQPKKKKKGNQKRREEIIIQIRNKSITFLVFKWYYLSAAVFKHTHTHSLNTHTHTHTHTHTPNTHTHIWRKEANKIKPWVWMRDNCGVSWPLLEGPGLVKEIKPCTCTTIRRSGQGAGSRCVTADQRAAPCSNTPYT